MAKLLVTGGAGFIGSHTCIALLEAGHEITIIDDFSNSSELALKRVQDISLKSLEYIKGDICDNYFLDQVFSIASKQGAPFEGVIHFAGLKSVGESVNNPLKYWNVNVCGSYSLLSAMSNNNCNTLVFSSSATLYGDPVEVPIKETAPIKPINPYGYTKAAVEQMLTDLFDSNSQLWRIACLRYFNPVGAHPSGLIGENPLGTPNNLFPYISQVAIGRRNSVSVFGGDWPTPDGTGIRDYIHVMDLAEGHVETLNYLLNDKPQLVTLNLGSGSGYSVLQLIKEFEIASGNSIPYEIVEKRNGDAAITIADPTLAADKIGWRCVRDITDICRDGWSWQSKNPDGYKNT
ncbi:UDP-glucose 4-epimerase GalE [Synechococcus sp. RS9916]|uniref:UDP-glucose 4-epimerase GalE n=1 Tax=Synechococcus sp. RS9916 TaxID=221359 RepID=UPI0000E538AF|nr:UDP-glucose 4-epimerase GalE [Synechococcus sp. RS9916]EAU75540.1 UDP-glucose 4-epimerase-like protein [Synechococcus sp. RS9916]